MANTRNRESLHTNASVSSHDRPKSGDAANKDKDMWSSMLDSVASGKRLPEKNVLVLGGTTETQREFLDALSNEDSTKRDRRNNKQPPIANTFALGYTYHDVLDADQEDILARLSLYLLTDPSPAFAPLLQTLLKPQSIPNTLIVVLLDWSQPWSWLRQLREWIRLLRKVLVHLDDDCKEKMEEVMISWRDRGRGGTNLDGGSTAIASEADVILPLGPGEWEDALGLPLCVVCQNADRIEALEREQGWKEEEFDFILQLLRTVLLKHGASLIYTMPSVESPLQTLIHQSLGIQSLLKRQPLKHSVNDRDKVVVPPNWDSWGKIRVIREGFDLEGVSEGWSIDIAGSEAQGQEEKGCVAIYEETARDPRLDSLQAPIMSQGSLEVSSTENQEFLASQLEILERLRQSADSNNDDSRTGGVLVEGYDDEKVDEGRVNEHIGPVQFNMGGIQVDAEDMLQRLKDRQNFHSPEPTTPNSNHNDASPGSETKLAAAPLQNEQLASFFAGLMKRGDKNGAVPSPKPGA